MQRQDRVCHSYHASFPISLASSRRIWSRPHLVMSLLRCGGRGRYEKEWNAVVPLLRPPALPRSLSLSLSPLIFDPHACPRCYRVDLMMVLAQHHPSKCHRSQTTARARTARRLLAHRGGCALRSFYASRSPTQGSNSTPVQPPAQGVSARS